MIDRAFHAARKSGLVKRGQKVVITAGVPLGVPGKTNLVKAEVLI
jgi:pyruvate kinase